MATESLEDGTEVVTTTTMESLTSEDCTVTVLVSVVKEHITIEGETWVEEEGLLEGIIDGNGNLPEELNFNPEDDPDVTVTTTETTRVDKNGTKTRITRTETTKNNGDGTELVTVHMRVEKWNALGRYLGFIEGVISETTRPIIDA